MFASKINIPFFSIKAALNKSLFSCHFLYYHGRVNTVAKRGSMLEDMIANRDKRKNWHFNIMPTKPKVRAFEKLHKPHRRRAVLNSLFISNITDVISTGEIIPDIVNFGIEITGVQISPCYKILNVFWQVPASRYDSCDDIGQLLAASAPKIRAELISRNVLGHVPFLFFLRDSTNARVAAYEEAMQKLDLEPKSELGVVVDDTFTKDMYSFKEAKVTKKEIPECIENETKEEEYTEEGTKIPVVPHKPLDMKHDVFGLNHELLMEKVIALKKRRKDPPQHTAVISPESLKDADDLFSKIPGVCFQASSSNEAESRDAILKKFHIERKMLKQKKIDSVNADNYWNCEDDDTEEVHNELNSFDHDFFEDETTDDSC